MSLYDSKKNLYRLLSYPYLNAYNRDLCERLLGELKKAEDSEYYTFYGSFLLLNKKYGDAKEAFNKSIENGVGIYSTYYGLYKIALKEEDYESAYKYALLCDERKQKTRVNFSLQTALAKMAMDFTNDPKEALGKEYRIEDDKVAFTDFSANLYYQKAIEAFNNRDMFSVRDNIIKLCENADLKGIPFDFFDLANSIDSLLLLQRDAYFESLKSTETRNVVSPREALNYINMTVNTDVSKAEVVFRAEEDWLSDEVDPFIINYMDKKITERKKYMSLDKNQLRFYKYSIHQIRVAIDTKNYEEAISWADKSMFSFDLPVFLYYKGKAQYLAFKYDEATKSLEGYLEAGSTKFNKASQYLAESYGALGKDTISEDVRRDYDVISDYFVDFTEADRKYSKKNNKGNKKASGTRNLNVNLSNLMSSELTLADYEGYGFRQKIGVIAGLYCDKAGVKKADKLIGQLERDAKTADEKDLVRAVKQNKKLLISKSNKGFNK